MSTPLVWQPSRRVYMRQAALLAVATFGAFMVLAALTPDAFAPSLVLIALVPAAVTGIFILEDFARWRRVRDERWEIEDGHLIHDSLEGRVMVPLEQIVEARKRFASAVVLKLANGQRVPMRYLENPDAVVAQMKTLLENPLVQPPN